MSQHTQVIILVLVVWHTEAQLPVTGSQGIAMAQLVLRKFWFRAQQNWDKKIKS